MFTATVTPFQLSPTERWTTAKFNQGFNATITVTGNLESVSNWNTVSAVTKTFTATDLVLDVITAVAHGLSIGQAVTVSSTVTLPTGLSSTATYYARALTVDTLSLHYTSAGASAGTNRVDISAVGSGTHTLSYTVYATGAPLIYNTGTSKWEYGRVQAISLPEAVGATTSQPGVRGAVPQPGPGAPEDYLARDMTYRQLPSPSDVGNNLYLNENVY